MIKDKLKEVSLWVNPISSACKEKTHINSVISVNINKRELTIKKFADYINLYFNYKLLRHLGNSLESLVFEANEESTHEISARENKIIKFLEDESYFKSPSLKIKGNLSDSWGLPETFRIPPVNSRLEDHVSLEHKIMKYNRCKNLTNSNVEGLQIITLGERLDININYVIFKFLDCSVAFSYFIMDKYKMTLFDLDLKYVDYKKKYEMCLGILNGMNHLNLQFDCSHSDLKPHNICLTEDLTIKIIDFGICSNINKEHYLVNTNTFITVPQMLNHIMHNYIIIKDKKLKNTILSLKQNYLKQFDNYHYIIKEDRIQNDLFCWCLLCFFIIFNRFHPFINTYLMTYDNFNYDIFYLNMYIFEKDRKKYLNFIFCELALSESIPFNHFIFWKNLLTEIMCEQTYNTSQVLFKVNEFIRNI
jgi:hypothetical protein